MVDMRVIVCEGARVAFGAKDGWHGGIVSHFQSLSIRMLTSVLLFRLSMQE